MAEEHVVIITGANSGIGLGMTRALLNKKFKVAAVDLKGDSLSELSMNFPETFIFIKADLTSTPEVNNAVKKTIELWNRADILVNNACLALFAPFEEKDPDDTYKEFEVNYFGYTRMIKAVLPYMKQQGNGIIHNVSSGVGLTGFSGMYGYASTKGAIEALTLTLRFELKPYGIYAGTMHPPLTRTPSAKPLGIPAEIMQDPEKVGHQLAHRILQTKPAVTTNFRTTIYLKFCRWFPHTAGSFMSKMAAKARLRQ